MSPFRPRDDTDRQDRRSTGILAVCHPFAKLTALDTQRATWAKEEGEKNKRGGT
jgi:hypothetical protein